MMDDLLALAQKQYVSPYGIASFYAVLGDAPHALDWLERAYAERDGTLIRVSMAGGASRASAICWLE